MKKLLTILLGLLTPIMAFAQDAAAAPDPINKADSAWIIVSTSLVLLMTPALSIFYGGLVRRKNVLNTMMLSFATMGIVSVIWVLAGFTIAFGKSSTGFIGDMTYLFGKNMAIDTPYGVQTIPLALFMLFQMKFAIITPALISGAVAERIKFAGFLAFTALWSLLVYAPLACWVWNPDGWLLKKGALDFAGGTVVHLASGISSLALMIVIGARKQKHAVPNNLTLTLLGAGMLWFGWFGFNAGSALAMDKLAVNAFMTTHLAAAAAMLSWMLAETITRGKASAIGCASGLVAGLVVITPAAGFVGIGPSIIMGLVAGVVCYFGIELKHKLGYDDALDVVGIHGLGGLLGAILTGVFADPLINAAVPTDRGALMQAQLISVVAVAAFAFVASFIIAKIVQVTIGLRSDDESETMGLDLSYHGEEGYDLATGESAPSQREAVSI